MFDVIYQESNGRRKRLDFKGDRCSIGSSRKNHLVIRSRRVSKEHAEIFMQNPKTIFIKDKDTKTGTWLNKERLSTPTSIGENDEIVIDDLKIWIRPQFSKAEEEQLQPGSSGLAEVTDDVKTKPLPAVSEPDVLKPQNDRGANSELMHWGEILHNKLIYLMDLRRKDVHRMSQEELRDETTRLIDDVLEDLQSDIPSSVSIPLLKLTVLNEAVGLGPLEQFLEDDSVTEIMVNSASEVFVEHGGKLTNSGMSFSGDHAVMSVIERIITPLGRRIDESSPMVDARLADGSRVNAVIPPLALKGPSITIRKFAKKKLQFDDLVKFDSVSQDMVDFLKVAVESHKNIIVSGGTGSGKTTLLNVLSNFIPDTERIITVEDAAELKLDQPNLVSLESKPANVEGKGQVSIRELVKNTLRMRPDRIVVGECRGGEALDMLQAMNTGHDGSLTTAHANSPRDVLSRLEVMVLMAGMDLPVTAIREQIASAVHIIVQQTRFPCGSRKITKVTEVVGIESGTIQLQDIFEFKQFGYGEDGKIKGEFRPAGFIPTFYEELRSIGINLDLAIFKSNNEAF